MYTTMSVDPVGNPKSLADKFAVFFLFPLASPTFTIYSKTFSMRYKLTNNNNNFSFKKRYIFCMDNKQFIQLETFTREK